MRAQRRTFALIAGAAVTLVAGLVMASRRPGRGRQHRRRRGRLHGARLGGGQHLPPSGRQVTYGGRLYQALVTHTAYVGRRLEPGRDAVAVAGPRRLHRARHRRHRRAPTTRPRHRRPPRRRPRPPPSHRPDHHAAAGRSTCAVKSRPGRQGAAGVLGELGRRVQRRTPAASAGSRSPTPGSTQHGYNVINAAFPVIRSDGTVLWEDGMDAGVKVATPAEMCQAKAAGADDPDVHRRRGGRHRPQLQRGRRPVRRDDRADPARRTTSTASTSTSRPA